MGNLAKGSPLIKKLIFFVSYLTRAEAHHATAKTYRKIIHYVKERVPNVKLIGLTATPFRTAEEEQGLLSKIFQDGVDDTGRVLHNEKGITYQIGLKELISARILSKPIFEYYNSDEDFGDAIGVDAWENIQHLDVLPDDIAEEMAESAGRNRLIVETYKAKQKDYGQTIVFAVNVLHAITLSKLFNDAGIAADFVVSDVKDSVTGVRISREDNERKLQEYRDGKLQVLVNVNILTEGVDLPQTKTVFLARPTVSTILMTQMIGRALRGSEAGGTSEAYIVSFVDQWNEHIAWVNPETIFIGNNEFVDTQTEYQKRAIRTIAISKIEEFARILDDTIDTSLLESIDFIQRVPVGMYVFSYLQENGMDISYQVMVYDSTQKAYETLMKELPELFKTYEVEDEFLDEDLLDILEEKCRDTYFCGEMLPPYEPMDVIHILKYFAQYEETPKFYTFGEVDRSKLDVAQIAQHIWDEEMGPRKKNEYIDEIWNSADDNLLKLFFGKKIYFMKQLDIELMKIADPHIYDDIEKNVKYGVKDFEDMPLYEIGKYDPNLEKELRDFAFDKAVNDNGEYCCAECDYTAKTRIPFQVDHIIPMNKGGKTKKDNLQILCRICNGRKGDK